jgi:chemotaxis-related protein WspD
VDSTDPKSKAVVPVSEESASLVPALSAVPGDFDCWNQIGVSGNGTCPELTKFVHCRNCPVYSAAGALLLDRVPPSDYRQRWTEHFAREQRRPQPGKKSVVIFRVGLEWMALSTKSFQEVAEERRIHSLPHRRNGIVLGLVNIRGELLICVSLARLLGLEKKADDAGARTLYERLVVAEWEGSLLTFPVNEVHGVHRCHPEEMKEAPATVAKANPGFTRSMFMWQGRRVGFLDEETLFSTLNRSLL